jgi:hypothetical protein
LKVYTVGSLRRKLLNDIMLHTICRTDLLSLPPAEEIARRFRQEEVDYHDLHGIFSKVSALIHFICQVTIVDF